MKAYLTVAAAGLFIFGLTAAQPAAAQDKGGSQSQTGNRNQGKVRPNFVDANGDGICDNQGSGVCTGSGSGGGTCNGTRQRLRLRDGSCGITPAPAGQPSGQPANQTPRRNRAK